MTRAKRGTQKIKRNSKTSKIECFRCGVLKTVLRNDTKFCSDLCRVQERIFRQGKGYVNLLFDGPESGLVGCYGYPPAIHKINNPLVEDCWDIKNYLKAASAAQSWKKEFRGFIVYYFHNSKGKPYQIYCNDEKFRKWSDFKEKEKTLQKKPNFSPHK